MIQRDFQNFSLPMLGMGTMRLPLTKDGKAVDEVKTEEMVRYALEHGIRYFDTAWPYHNGTSELVIGKILRKFPRDSYYLADKYPGHQIAESYNPADTFETQLKKCGVDYFDFYLLHNINDLTLPTYTDPRWNILPYFREQKRLGRIRHLGFSTHATPEVLKTILELFGEDMEFCQIQMNYLDWSLQDAKAKYDMLTERGIPVWVMEPVRGGKLAQFTDEHAARMQVFRPEATAAEWSLRWLMQWSNVKMVLTGASSLEQLSENIAIFEKERPLTAAEDKALYAIAEKLKGAIPCTACRYCIDGCPMGLDIPKLLSLYSDYRYSPTFTVSAIVDSFPEDKRPSSCIACGACTHICPQHIAIPDELHSFADMLAKHPSWSQVCREREEAAKKLQG